MGMETKRIKIASNTDTDPQNGIFLTKFALYLSGIVDKCYGGHFFAEVHLREMDAVDRQVLDPATFTEPGQGLNIPECKDVLEVNFQGGSYRKGKLSIGTT